MKSTETAAKMLFSGAALISAFITFAIFGFMLMLGIPLFRECHFFTLLTQSWQPYHGLYGIYPMILGTLAISFMGLVFAFPLSLGCAAFISVLGPDLLRQGLRKVVRLMTGIPTVIYGFVGIFLLVPVIRGLFQQGSGMCILSAALMLAILISPTMLLFFTDSFDHVPKSYLDAVEALGGTRVQKFLYVILPCSRNGILSGVVLALGRALGDTLIALMIAGNAVQIPGSILDSARTLTAHIALVIAADYESLTFKSIFACGIMLYVFTLIMVLIVRWLGTGKQNQ